MGYDALWPKNSTGLAVQHQALSFAGSTLNPGKPLKMELPGSDSRNLGGTLSSAEARILPGRDPEPHGPKRAARSASGSPVKVDERQDWWCQPQLFAVAPDIREAALSGAN
jgi:hypothetical protein